MPEQNTCHKQFSTYEMELQISYSVCPKVSEESILWTKRREAIREIIKDFVSMERCRNNRRRSMPGPHTSISKYTTQNERFELYGVFKRKK